MMSGEAFERSSDIYMNERLTNVERQENVVVQGQDVKAQF